MENNYERGIFWDTWFEEYNLTAAKVVKEMNMSFPENATKSKLWFFLKYNSIDLK